MNFYIYRRVACAAAYCGICMVCLYGFINAQRSTRKELNRSSFDWYNVAEKRNIVPIAVIGSGPAGLSAAMYGARAGIKSVVFEGDEPGGLLTETGYVENWPGSPHVQGEEIMERLRTQAGSFGVKCLADTVEEVDLSRWPYFLRTVDGETVYALSVVIATGAGPRHLNVEGEQEYWGRGVSACARCDALCYKGKEVVVVGGGDSAIEEALQLVPFAKKVTIVHRRDELRASSHMQSRIKKRSDNKGDNEDEIIDLLLNKCIKRIIGDDDGVTAVELIDTQTQETSIMPINGVFIAVGHEPHTALFKDYLSTNEQGYLVLEKRTQETTIPGVFAAGDVADPHYRQAGSAAGDGIKAGIDATLFLQEIGYTSNRAQELSIQMFEAPECV